MTDPTSDAATIEQAARELLAAEYDKMGDEWLPLAKYVRSGSSLEYWSPVAQAAFRAISTALRSRSDLRDEPTEAEIDVVARAIYDRQHHGLRSCYSWDDAWEQHQEHRREQYLKDERGIDAGLRAAQVMLHRSASLREVDRELARYIAELDAKIEAKWNGGVRLMVWGDIHFSIPLATAADFGLP